MISLLNEASNSVKWNISSDQSNANYDVGNEIIYNTKVLTSNLCDYDHAYILRGDVIVVAQESK